MHEKDKRILRDLATRYMTVATDDEQNRRRRLWRCQNSLRGQIPLIYVRAFAWHEIRPEPECESAVARSYEDWFRRHLFWAGLNDDSIFEPWITVPAVRAVPPGGVWGLPIRWHGRAPGMAGICESPLKEPEDFARMAVPHHEVDEQKTAERVDELRDAVGDIITVDVDRAPLYRNWNGDISTLVAQLRGLEQIMWDMMDRPQWLHQLLAFMRDGILKTHREAEEAGHWTLSCHSNQAMSYAEELRDPEANSDPVKREDLWYFCASQEYAVVGPRQFDEFMLQYQLPIVSAFGLSAYGCCEDLSDKIDVLRQIPNLRRIAVSPMADVGRCAEQIGDAYVFSYRPSPSDMVGYGFDEGRIRRILNEDLSACRHCHVDVTLKDVETVQGDPTRLPRWLAIAREVIDDVFG
jgi:hypothetical protein